MATRLSRSMQSALIGVLLLGSAVAAVAADAQSPQDSTFWSTPGGASPGVGNGLPPPGSGTAAPVVVVTMAPAPPMSAEELSKLIGEAKPLESNPNGNPMDDVSQIMSQARTDSGAGQTGAPKVFDGKTVVTVPKRAAPSAASSSMAPTAALPTGGISAQNYGSLSYNSGYMYNDRLARMPVAVVGATGRNDPESRVGILTGQFAGRPNAFRCSAALIAPSIIVTSAQCAHTGGTSGVYATNLRFVPGHYVRFDYHMNGGAIPVSVSPWGEVPIINGAVAAGWRTGSSGALNKGVDVALFGVGYRAGTSDQIGFRAGYLSFCFENCLQNLWAISGYGYAQNYGVLYHDIGFWPRFIPGETLYESHALGLSSGFDYTFGTGMNSGGAIGGPYITNPGDAYDRYFDSGADRGQFVNRNVVYAVRSWGYDTVFDSYKIGGASPLSGTGVDNNNFKAMYNAVCAQVRAAQTESSCELIP